MLQAKMKAMSYYSFNVAFNLVTTKFKALKNSNSVVY